MASKGRRRERRLLQSALRGGAAGVIGGAVIALVEREVLSRVTGGARHRSRWDDVAANGLSHIGLELGDRGRIATGIASQIAYAGLLGAAYAVLRDETRESRAGRILLDGAMTYAASLVFPEPMKPVITIFMSKKLSEAGQRTQEKRSQRIPTRQSVFHRQQSALRLRTPSRSDDRHANRSAHRAVLSVQKPVDRLQTLPLRRPSHVD